jgi:predicted phosphodiesterase
MRTVIFSDSHLSSRVYRKKLAYLTQLIQSADRVIILGDFWDGFLTDFDGFIHSGWQRLFPLLKERQTIYLYGNHDRAQWSDERVNLFSVKQGLEYTLTMGDKQLYLTHGHTIFTSLEERYPALNKSIPLRVGSSIDIMHKLVWGRFFLRDGRPSNETGKRWVAQFLPESQILVCGHRHYPELDSAHRFINTGFIGSGHGSYVLVEGESIKLVKEKY